MVKRGGYKKLLRDYLGAWDIPPIKQSNKKRIWIQAVSVGELRAISPLLNRLAEDKNIEIVLTTTTSTGYTLAKEQYTKYCLAIKGFPLDFFPISRRVWKQLQPDIAILIDSELWPEHLHQAEKSNTPVLLVNARLSERSYRRYCHIRYFTQRLLSPVSAVLASSENDAKRFIEIGIPQHKVKVTGNLKFDIPTDPILSKDQQKTLLKECGFEVNDRTPNTPLILLGSSTWPREEAFLIDCLDALEQKGISCRLLLVPRHAERRNTIATLLKQQERAFHFRSQSRNAPSPVAIYVADTTGELNKMTQIADIVFIGKSLPPNSGGQSPIEAAALGKVLLIGSHMENFRDISESLLQTGSAYLVSNPEALKAKVLQLATNQLSRNALAKAAKDWHNKQKGACKKVLSHIYKYI